MLSWLSTKFNQFTIGGQSPFQEAMFLVHLRKLSKPLIQIIGFFSIGFIVLTHPLDYLSLGSSTFNHIIRWRLLLILFLLWPILAVRVSSWFEKKINLFFSINFVLACFFTGFYLFPIEEPSRSFRYVVYVIPLWSVITPSNIAKRSLITVLSLSALFGAYCQLGWSNELYFLYVPAMIIMIGVCLVSILIGHFLFYSLNRRNFFQSRELKKTRRRAEEAQRQSEKLLLNILPETVSEQLKDGKNVAEQFDEATVLFADIVEFTPLANNLPAHDVVRILDDMFSAIDQLVLEHGLEKIKTIGDEYFVAAGVPEPIENHASKMAELALDMQDEVRQHKRHDGTPFKLRCGMNTGPLVAGIIGKEKFVYDVWGDTVNLGSRMESQGVPGAIQVTPGTKEAIEEQSNGEFDFKKRGVIEVKGKGRMTTFLLHKPGA